MKPNTATEMSSGEYVKAASSKRNTRSSQLLAAHRHQIYSQCDRMFIALMLLQWIGGIAVALVVSPHTWIGPTSSNLQSELVVTSRQAGMAEVATGVLHNVGNVLNSVNVSAIDTTYHRTIHSETGQTPHDRYFSESRIVRSAAIESVQSYFFEREARRQRNSRAGKRCSERRIV